MVTLIIVTANFRGLFRLFPRLFFEDGSFLEFTGVGVVYHVSKLGACSDDSVVWLVVVFVIAETLVVFGCRLNGQFICDHAVAEGLQQLQEVFEVSDFATGDGFATDVVEVIFDDFGDEVDDSLYFLAGRKGLVLAESEEVDDGFWKDDLAYLEIDLFVCEDLNLLNPATNAHILENVYRNVYDRRLARTLLSLLHFSNNIYWLSLRHRLLQRTAALRTLLTYLRPVLDTLPVKVVPAACVNSLLSALLTHETDWANLLSRSILSGLLEFIFFGGLDWAVNRVVIVDWFQEHNLSWDKFSLLEDSGLHFVTSDG